MKSEKGRKKEKQPRRIPNPIYLVRDALVKQEEKKKEKEKGKRYTDPSKPTPLMPATQKKMHKSISFRSAHNSKFKKT
jgi:hypothetical protein